MTWTEQVARPDGTIYRARKAPSVEEFGGFGTSAYDPSGVIVARTHDIDVATVLAAPAWQFGGPLPAAVRRWVRLVPWSDQGYDSTWLGADPHERGAIPVVEFRQED